MEQLPVEIVAEIFEKILWKDPAGLCRLRVVCKIWRDIIDNCWSRLFHFSPREFSEIPEKSLDDIVQTLFPLSSKPWQKCYWKDRMLSHVPRAVYQAWKSFPKISGEHPTTTRCPIYKSRFIDACMNDKYFAVSYIPFYVFSEDFGEYHTCIYELSNLEHPIRDYPLLTKNLDFYTVGSRIFIVMFVQFIDRFSVDQKAAVYMCEFERNIQPTEVDCNILNPRGYAIVENECFTFTRIDVTHQMYINDRFVPSTTISLPSSSVLRTDYKKRDFDPIKYHSIQRLRIESSEIFVLTASYRHWILRYEIAREPDETLNFTPIATKFILEMRLFDFSLFYRSEPMEFRFFLKLDDFNLWFREQYSCFSTSVMVHGNYIIATTQYDQVFIFNQGIDDLMDCISQDKISLDYTVIDLEQRGDFVSSEITVVGLNYVDSTPRLVLKDFDSIFVIDFN